MADVKVTSTATYTVDVVGVDNIKADLKLELPQPFKTDAVNTIDVKPLKAEAVNTIDLKPLKTDVGTNSHIIIEPLKTDSSLEVDLKPAVVDLCLTLNSGKAPNLCIRQPYRHKIGFTLYGIEVFGFTFSGEQETVVNEVSPRLQTAPREDSPWPPARAATTPIKSETSVASGAGLRIRLDP